MAGRKTRKVQRSLFRWSAPVRPRTVELVLVAKDITDSKTQPDKIDLNLVSAGREIRQRYFLFPDRRDALGDARLGFVELGAALWADRASEELTRISGPAPRSGGLTETERRIADLVTSGKSNKQIAAELHITVRTVESNLTRIYRKLGVTSRGQLTQLVRQ